MTWLKHNGKLINLAHVHSINLTGKELEIHGARITTVSFNSEEAAESYFEHVAHVLGVSE